MYKIINTSGYTSVMMVDTLFEAIVVVYNKIKSGEEISCIYITTRDMHLISASELRYLMLNYVI